MVLRSKQRQVVLALEATPRDRTWDCEYDIYTHLQMKNRVLKSENEKFNYFNTLLQEFVVKDPKADPELVQFTNGLSSIIQSQVLHLQDQNREDTVKENGTEEEEEEDSMMVDPQYKYFLDHLMPHGKSYVLNISEDDVFVKYENESSSTHGNIAVFATDNANHVSDETEAIVRIDTDRHKGRCRARKSKNEKLSAAKSPNVRSKCVASNSKRGRGRGRSKRLKKQAVPMNVNGEGVSAVKVACFTQTEGQTIEGKQTDNPSGIETKVKVEIEDYHDDDDAPDIRMHVQILDLKVDPLQQDNEVNAREFTEFRENLMKELKRPYCEEEHKRLLQDITARKPVQHHKDLRGRIKIYEEDYPGKSLLDHHVDLAEAIDSALDDHPRVLNLLRGFFYWLRNLSHEGAFMPWRVLDGLPQQ